MSVDGNNNVSITVRFHQGSHPTGSCGYIDAEDSPATDPNFDLQVTGGTIHLYEKGVYGLSCEPYSDTLTHEIGHMLGLGDAPSICSNQGYIMAARSITPGGLGTRTVRSSDCQVAFLRNPMPTPGSKPPNPEEDEETGCDGSPIIIDLGQGGFKFTDSVNGVVFDIDANGILEMLAWTELNTEDAFLVLDRNCNGTIDDGSELFGDAAQQPLSETPNGYEALAVYDKQANGGDESGDITQDDAIFSSLQLWIDANKNGSSESYELSQLSDYGILSIELDYREIRRTDRHGNALRYMSKVALDNGHWIWSTDVFFVIAAE
jgi:hypothetical protein